MKHARFAAVTAALTMTGGALAAVLAAPAGAAASYHDSACAITASGADPVSGPCVESTDGTTRSNSGGVTSSAGTTRISGSTVRAGGGTASVQVQGFSALGGLVQAGSVTATCEGGKATSSASGTPSGPVGNKGSVSRNVPIGNGVIALQVVVKSGKNNAATTINVGVVSCAPVSNPGPGPSSRPPTAPPGGSPSSRPTRPPAGQPSKPSTRKPAPAAPPAQPGDGHLAVTG